MDQWERTLSHILEVIEMTIQVQRQWMYLEVSTQHENNILMGFRLKILAFLDQYFLLWYKYACNVLPVFNWGDFCILLLLRNMSFKSG